MTAVQPQAVVDERPAMGRPGGAELLAMSGMDVLAAHRAGERPPPPISFLLGLVVTAFQAGAVDVAMPVSRWLAGLRGDISPAVTMLIADLSLNAAVSSVLPAGTLFTTGALTLEMRSPSLPTRGALHGTARVTTMTRNAGCSSVTVTDDGGTVVAVGRSSIALLSSERVHPALLQDQTPPDAFAWPDVDRTPPFLREPRGHVITADVDVDERALLQSLVDGDLPHPPIGRLLGVHPVAVGDATARWQMPASPWLATVVPGRLYGGSLACLAGLAMECAAATLARGTATHLRTVSVRFRRPVGFHGRPLIARATAVPRGVETHAVAEVHDTAGAVVATANGTCVAAQHSMRRPNELCC